MVELIPTLLLSRCLSLTHTHSYPTQSTSEPSSRAVNSLWERFWTHQREQRNDNLEQTQAVLEEVHLGGVSSTGWGEEDCRTPVQLSHNQHVRETALREQFQHNVNTNRNNVNSHDRFANNLAIVRSSASVASNAPTPANLQVPIQGAHGSVEYVYRAQ